MFIELSSSTPLANILTTTYDPLLVALSILIAISSSFSAFGISERAASTSKKTSKIAWNLFGATAMGFGIWAMHFMGMLAFHLPIPVSYNISITILSVIPAICACSVVLWMMTQKEFTYSRLLFSGVLLGSGIGAMHYTGMMAMQLNASMIHNTGVFYLSLLVAVILATVALKINNIAVNRDEYYFLNKKQISAAIVMGVATSGMHYTAMQAVYFIPLQSTNLIITQDINSLAIMVGVVMFIILVFAMLIPHLLRFKQITKELYLHVESLNESKAKIQAIIDSSYDALIQIDSTGKVIGWSRQAEKMFGWIENEILGRKLDGFIVPVRYRKSYFKEITKFLARDEEKHFNKIIESKAINKNAEEFPVEFILAAVKIKKGFEFNAFVRDISDRRKAEENLLLFASIFRDIRDGIIITDIKGAIIDVNPSFCKITGYCKDEVLGKNPNMLNSGKQDADFYKKMWLLLEHHGHWQGEVWNCKKNGELYAEILTISALKNDSGKTLHYVGLFTDITKRIQQEVELQQSKEDADKANRTKSEFLANMSHELRTPMHAILSFSKIGIKKLDTADKEQLHKYFSNIEISGERLLGLLNELLDLSKLESGKMELNINYHDLVTVFKNCQLEQDQLMKDSSIKLQINKPLYPVTGHFDAPRIGQIMTNLLSNAIKFSPKASLITVTIDKVGNQDLFFSIKDQGIGIPESELDDVFDAFVQSSKTKTGAGGTGLGLAICKQIMKAHNGEIWAESTSEGGALFKFVI